MSDVKVEVTVVTTVSREEELKRCGVSDDDPYRDLYVVPPHMNPAVRMHHIIQIIRAIYNVLMGKPLTASMVIHVVFAVWQVTKNMEDLRGGVKKEVMMWGIQQVVSAQDTLSKEDSVLLMMMVEEVLSGMIDTISAAKKSGAKIPCWLSCCVSE